MIEISDDYDFGAQFPSHLTLWGWFMLWIVIEVCNIVKVISQW